MIYLIILLVLIVLGCIYLYKHRFPPLSCVSLVTGAVKSGKSSFAVWRCVTLHFQRLVIVSFTNLFRKNKREIPLLYSNIPLRYKWYRKLTIEHVLRKVRFNYGSIVYVNEASLLADSFSYKDEYVNNCLLLFNKLFGHENYGSLLIYDTQSLSDCHFAIKRCISEYIHLDGMRKGLFGFTLNYRRMKMTSSQDSIDVNVFDGKEEERPSVWIPKLVWKIFDAFCFSCLTDNLPTKNVKASSTSLKTNDIVTVNKDRFNGLIDNNNLNNNDTAESIELKKYL